MTQEKKFVLKYVAYSQSLEGEGFEVIIGPLEETYHSGIAPTNHSNIAISMKAPSQEKWFENFYPFSKITTSLIAGNYYQLTYTGKLRKDTYAIAGINNGELKEFKNITSGFSVRKWVKEEIESLQEQLIKSKKWEENWRKAWDISQDRDDRLSKEHSKLEAKYNNLQNEKDNLKKELGEWRDKFYIKDGKCDEYKKKYENAVKEIDKLKKELNDEKIRYVNKMSDEKSKSKDEKSALEKKITKLEEKLESSNSQNIELKKDNTNLEKKLENAKEELKLVRAENEKKAGALEIKLDEKSVKIQELNNQLADSKVESNNKETKLQTKIKEQGNELKQKDQEIERLKKREGMSREELLNEKLGSERGSLERFATELKISLEKIHSLSKYHERLFAARKSHNQTNIDAHEENIARTKQELSEKEVSIVNIQEICQKCEKIAELRWELDQIQQKQTQMNQASNWKNINPNFTPELVQEWINNGFTYEQCQEWINTSSPWQHNRAIKEPVYYAWLRDAKKVNSEWVINQGNEQELGQEFFQWYQEQYQAQQEVSVK